MTLPAAWGDLDTWSRLRVRRQTRPKSGSDSRPRAPNSTMLVAFSARLKGASPSQAPSDVFVHASAGVNANGSNVRNKTLKFMLTSAPAATGATRLSARKRRCIASRARRLLAARRRRRRARRPGEFRDGQTRPGGIPAHCPVRPTHGDGARRGRGVQAGPASRAPRVRQSDFSESSGTPIAHGRWTSSFVRWSTRRRSWGCCSSSCRRNCSRGRTFLGRSTSARRRSPGSCSGRLARSSSCGAPSPSRRPAKAGWSSPDRTGICGIRCTSAPRSRLPAPRVYYQSVLLLAYASVFLLFSHFFVVLYEEPALQRTFGEEYDVYRRHVGRWGPSASIKRGQRASRTS